MSADRAFADALERVAEQRGTHSAVNIADLPRSGNVTAASSWLPVGLDAILAGDHVDPLPAVLRRDDGPALLYPAKVHSVSGESETLKSWLLLVGAVEQIGRGRPVVWIDFEDSAPAVVGRLVALGCPRAGIAEHFRYVRPTDPLPDGAALFDLSAPPTPTLAVIDGVTEGMALHDLEPNSNSDVASFMALLPRPLAALGPAVVLIDHVTKSADSRGRYAIGAQHKLAGLDGAAYTLDLVQPFGHGRKGLARIDVAKDRPGRVREHASGGKHIAELHLTSEADGSVFAELRAPDGTASAGTFRPTVLMERVSRHLEDHPDGQTQRQVLDAVTGKRDAKRTALDVLVSESHVDLDSAQRSHTYRSLTPYRESDPA